MYQYPDYMYHHGIKGMKWGVRRANKKRAKDKAFVQDRVKLAKAYLDNSERAVKNIKKSKKEYRNKESYYLDLKDMEQAVSMNKATIARGERAIKKLNDLDISSLKQYKDYRKTDDDVRKSLDWQMYHS